MRFPNAVHAGSLGLMALIIALGASACGGGGDVDKAALKSKMKSEQDFKGAPNSFIDCMVDATLKYADKDSLQSYVDGKTKLDDVKGLSPADKEARKAAETCVQQAG
ncbi:MAG TPA: hypothetical protein VFU43_03915 [Streptosporangiaceae bacterium]|nr:hypothetical protein [Streptosporangiaceae bacterium]